MIELINILSFIATIYILINHITSGVILIGTFLFYVQSVDRFTGAVSDIFVGIAFQEENINMASEIVDYLHIKPLINTKNAKPYIAKSDINAPEIEFKNVSFKYPDSETYVLKDISFKIKSGERVGLVGINGAGKSTMVKLLLRIYDPTGGDILIDGTNLKDINPQDWWNHLSALMQDFNQYQSLTVKESLMISNLSKTGELDKYRFMSSLKKSGASDFIEKWENKYDSVIGKNFGGESLSKGQAQKMALSRTFYKEASVMILDEPTAAIDVESEISIFEELEKLPRTTSVFYISHDMATIKKADRVILIEDGKITENGSHDELMAQNGHYARIYNDQLDNLTKTNA